MSDIDQEFVEKADQYFEGRLSEQEEMEFWEECIDSEERMEFLTMEQEVRRIHKVRKQYHTRLIRHLIYVSLATLIITIIIALS